MAADSWTLNLECEGAAPGHEYVQKEMNSDEICILSLIGFIEQCGYAAIDYLYYKRRGRGAKATLVEIDYDSDLTKMLQENENKKKINLFVTKQKINGTKKVGLSPVKLNKEPARSAPKEAKGEKGSKKRLYVIQTRAQYANEVEEHDDEILGTLDDDDEVKKPPRRTVLSHIWDLPEDKRILVRCNQLGQPIGKEGGFLGKFLGTVAQNSGYCPLDLNDWRKVKKDGGASTILQFVKWILKSIGRDWRRYKATLKKTLFNPKKKRSLYKLCPDDVDEDQWIALVQLENLVDEQPELAQSNEGRVTWQGDALHQVLGEEKPGQVHGLGLLPVPKQVYDRTTRHFKDIKVARIDGSLSDIEAHMLEEIRQLKEHSRKQDQVIEELLNKQTRLENGEPTMVDCGATNHEKQVLHPRRKRVQCNITNHEDLLSDQIDEMDKERYEAQQIRHEDANYKELSHQDAESSSPPCSPNGSRQVEFGMHRRNSRGGRIVNEGKMCKRQYEVFQEATSLTQ